MFWGMKSGAPIAQLLARAQAGDREALDALFNRLGDESAEGAEIVAMARRLLPPGDRLRDFIESRDLVQSALRSGWLDLSQFEGETTGELFGWLRAILRHKLGRAARRRTPEHAEEESLEDGAIAAGRTEEEPIASLVREEVKARVWAAVARLPEHERAVMEMRMKGLNAPEIAQILGIDAAAVRKRESRAGERLRGMMKSLD